MPRPSRTGIRGLYRNDDGRFRIDLRWTDPKTGASMRHQELLPRGLPAAPAKRRTQELLSAAFAGILVPRAGEIPATLRAAFDKYLEHVKTELGARAHTDRSL